MIGGKRKSKSGVSKLGNLKSVRIYMTLNGKVNGIGQTIFSESKFLVNSPKRLRDN